MWYVMEPGGVHRKCDDSIEATEWFETSMPRSVRDGGRSVDRTDLGSRGVVSTVFLALDHSFGCAGGPVLFETMVFGGPHDGYQERYRTLAEAEQGHARVVGVLESGGDPNGGRE